MVVAKGQGVWEMGICLICTEFHFAKCKLPGGLLHNSMHVLNAGLYT